MRHTSPISTQSTSSPNWSSPSSQPAWTARAQRTPSPSATTHEPSSERSEDLIFAFSPSLAEEVAASQARSRARGSWGHLGAACPHLKDAQRAGVALQALLAKPTAPRCSLAAQHLASAFSDDTDTASSLGVTSDDATTDHSRDTEPSLAPWLAALQHNPDRPTPGASPARGPAWLTPRARSAHSSDDEPASSPCAQAAKRRRQG